MHKPFKKRAYDNFDREVGLLSTWRNWVEIVDSDLSIDVVLSSKYSCAKKYCKNMSSCEEAYYKLNTCGHGRLDRDNDGVPCESICPGGG